jgi:hypothetical protein
MTHWNKTLRINKIYKSVVINLLIEIVDTGESELKE